MPEPLRIRTHRVTSVDTLVTTDTTRILNEGDFAFLTGDEHEPEVFGSVADAERWHLRRALARDTHISKVEE